MTTREVASRDDAGGVVFLPWLLLGDDVDVGPITFCRWSHAQRHWRLEPVHSVLTTIVGAYVDIDAESVQSAAVAIRPNAVSRPWDLGDSDLDDVQWAAQLLFLSCMSSNQYGGYGLDRYVNSTEFEVVGQRYSGSPEWITLTWRTRGGGMMGGGYRHAEVRFTVPLQARRTEPVEIDTGFLTALTRASERDSVPSQRMATALPYVLLANTDSNMMRPLPEAILMASAFEQLFNAKGNKEVLVKRFGEALQPFAKTTTADALATRPHIRFAGSTKQAEQMDWPVHKKWIEELYDVRSKAAHRGTIAVVDKWGWTLWEHLLMASWLFPRVVKVQLAADGDYVLTERDRGELLSVDALLSARSWTGSTRSEQWASIVHRTSAQRARDAAVDKFLKKRPGH